VKYFVSIGNLARTSAGTSPRRERRRIARRVDDSLGGHEIVGLRGRGGGALDFLMMSTSSLAWVAAPQQPTSGRCMIDVAGSTTITFLDEIDLAQRD